jgi:subtilase family serine protease
MLQSLEPRLMLSVSAVSSLNNEVAHPTYVRFSKAGSITPLSTTGATGLTPTQIKDAYGIDSVSFSGGITGTGSGQTIGIIDAYNDPRMFSSSDVTDYDSSDLYKFDSAMGLPQFAASSSSGPTFTKLNESGGTSYPTTDAGWSGEIALDVEWAHAIAPQANIVLVEATSDNYDDMLGGAVPTAVANGANIVSMSFGGDEFSGENEYDTDFTHSGVTYVASTGDDGAPGYYPAFSPDVLAVGGTKLTLNSDNTWSSEAAWNNFTLVKGRWLGGATGGGISTQYSKPAFQSSVTTISSSDRMIPDVSFDADPNSGVPVYDTENNTTASPWSQYGGTSLSSPCWAGLIAIADQGREANGLSELDTATVHSKLYQLSSSDFHDVLTGNNDDPAVKTSGYTYFSAAGGYDLTTGLGTPVANLLIPDLDGLPQLPSAPSGLTLSAASDSGVSNSDHITNITTPALTGTAVAGSTVKLYENSILIGQGTADTITGAFSIVTSALTNGTYAITATATTSGGTSTASGSVSFTIDTVAPTIGTLSFNPNQTPMTITVPFSKNVSLSSASLSVNGVSASSQAVTFNTSNDTATFTFPGLNAHGILTDGNYTATVAVSNVTDVAGNHPGATNALTFFFYDGDVNGDRKVNALDFNVLATNFGQVGKSYAQGDLNYDGTVNSADFAILAAKFGSSLAADVPEDSQPADAPAPATSSTAPQTSVFSDQPVSDNLAGDVLS